MSNLITNKFLLSYCRVYSVCDIISIGVNMNRKNVFSDIIDYILVILLVILSLSKGGFYKSDILIFTVGLSLISLIYLNIKFVLARKENKCKFDIVSFMLLLLFIAYLFPIILGNYADLDSSIFEAIRYFNLYLIYNIVKNSKNKKVYVYSIIFITILQCLLSVDATGNRYLEKILYSLGSGYLDMDLKRMSGTLQYANVLSILCLISTILIFKYIKRKKNMLKYSMLYILTFILLSTLILTGTRSVLILCISFFISILFLKRQNIISILFAFIPLFILVGIYTSNYYSAMLSNKVYYIFILYVVLCYIMSIVVYKLNEKYIRKYENIKLEKSYIIFISFFIIFLFIILFTILSLNITKPLLVSSNNQNDKETIILDDVKEGLNVIKFKVYSNEEDARYNIKLQSVDNENISKNIKEFNYTDNVSGQFEYEFYLSSDIKHLNMYIDCYKGKIKIDRLYLNDKIQKLEYVLISRNLIYRFKDLLNGSTSTSDRLMYYKDAFKIISKTAQNFVIGTGGEGFNNIYKQIQTKKYFSTEVHSSFLQIFVEAGIFGFLIIMSILIYIFINTKNNYYKLAFFVFIIHSFIDLDFSYMFMIAIFGIFLALFDYKESKTMKNKYLNVIMYIVSCIASFIVLIICSNCLIARNINIPQYDNESLDLERQKEIISKNNRRVSLDKYEYNYRKNLDKEYSIYLDMLYNEGNNVSDEKVQCIVDSIIKNLNEILKNKKYDEEQILYACRRIYLTITNLPNNIKEKYSTNLIDIYDRLEHLRIIYNNNNEIDEEINQLIYELN